MVVSMGGESPFQYGLFGEDSVKLKKDSTTDSYNSSDGDYDEDTAGDNGNVTTNNTEDDSITVAKNTVFLGASSNLRFLTPPTPCDKLLSHPTRRTRHEHSRQAYRHSR